MLTPPKPRVVDDKSPQLGANLDVNGQSIVSANDGNILITPNGTGTVTIGSDLTVTGDIIIANAGNIGSVTTTDAMAIASTGIATFKTGIVLTAFEGGLLDMNTNSLQVDGGGEINEKTVTAASLSYLVGLNQNLTTTDDMNFGSVTVSNATGFVVNTNFADVRAGVFLNSAATRVSDVIYQDNGVDRWITRMDKTTGGATAFQLLRHNASGVFQSFPLTVNVATGVVTFADGIDFADTAFCTFDKASGNGIKVDTTTPTFGFADIIGDQFSKNTGGTKPTLAAYNGVIKAWQFGTGDEAYITYHIPHDHVPGTDIFLHIHWSQTSATATGGTITFRYTGIYAKAHNQVSGSTFTSTPITATFTTININDGASGLFRYQQFLTEIAISGASATSALFDRDNFEPDGVIELTFEMDSNDLTNSVTVLDPFVHYVDLHYQTTGLFGTKAKAPDFYV